MFCTHRNDIVTKLKMYGTYCNLTFVRIYVSEMLEQGTKYFFSKIFVFVKQR